LRYGPDACPEEAVGFAETAEPPWGEMPPGGYRRRRPEDYDRLLCLIPRDAADFILATSPRSGNGSLSTMATRSGSSS
jgi:hypothetical protein